MINEKELVPEGVRNLELRRVTNDMTIADEWRPILFYEQQDGKNIPLAAAGELLVIAGGKKSRKSFLVNVFLASRYPDQVDRFQRVGFELKTTGPILYFDTEQPKHRVKRNRRRYHELIGVDNDQDDTSFIQYSLRGLTPHMMRECITHSIQKQVETGFPPSMIVIDQILDLSDSRDENDKTTFVTVMDMLNVWIEMTGALMCVVIHTNRDETNTNGKAGSFLDQKTDCTFKLKFDRDSSVTEIEHWYSRERRMPNVSFTQDLEGYPRFITEQVKNKSYF